MAALARRQLGHVAPPVRNPSPERERATMSRHPMKCTGQPAWGTRDSVLARMVFLNIVDSTPPIQIDPNPLTNARIRRLLRMHRPT